MNRRKWPKAPSTFPLLFAQVHETGSERVFQDRVSDSRRLRYHGIHRLLRQTHSYPHKQHHRRGLRKRQKTLKKLLSICQKKRNIKMEFHGDHAPAHVYRHHLHSHRLVSRAWFLSLSIRIPALIRSLNGSRSTST